MAKLRDNKKRKIKRNKVISARLKSILTEDGSICSQPALFRELWAKNRAEDGQYYCQLSGENISQYHEPHDMWTWACAHVLDKKNYSFWKYRIDNLMLVHPEIHALLDQGSKAQQAKSRFPAYSFELFSNLRERFKSEYADYKRDNQLP
jgi:hypothetical protein